MTSHFTGTTKTEDGVAESSVWRGASSDDCEKQAARVQTWRAAADRSACIQTEVKPLELRAFQENVKNRHFQAQLASTNFTDVLLAVVL